MTGFAAVQIRHTFSTQFTKGALCTTERADILQHRATPPFLESRMFVGPERRPQKMEIEHRLNQGKQGRAKTVCFFKLTLALGKNEGTWNWLDAKVGTWETVREEIINVVTEHQNRGRSWVPNSNKKE